MITVLCGTQTVKPSDVNTVRGDLCRGRKGAGESPEMDPYTYSKAGGGWGEAGAGRWRGDWGGFPRGNDSSAGFKGDRA